jgi:hypothetical protein
MKAKRVTLSLPRWSPGAVGLLTDAASADGSTLGTSRDDPLARLRAPAMRLVANRSANPLIKLEKIGA